MTSPRNVLAVIPARYASTRFPGKPLAMIAGKPMIVRVWEQASRAEAVDAVVVATDDERIAEVCGAHGIDWELTAATHATGTDRLAEVAGRRAAAIYVNVQGDEPLVEPASIDKVVRALLDARERGIGVSTCYLEGATPEQRANTSVVQLETTVDGCVMTFSRLPIPLDFAEPAPWKIHVGLFAFTADALERFQAWERGPVERAESVELIRVVEHGERIVCVPVPPGSIGVDNPEDVARVEAALAVAGAD
jgi:3-deoxy-manno-octulosonate cytidylyltransferase (CMP-KDO synthetase)